VKRCVSRPPQASFIHGMALGEAGSAADTAAPATAARGGAAHALLTVSDASEAVVGLDNVVGVVELTTKRCPTPLAERGREAADEAPFVCNLAVAPGARCGAQRPGRRVPRIISPRG
jgi:hypothetical protein